MKKSLCFILVAVILLSACPFAFAEEPAPPVCPVLPDGHPEDRMPALPSDSLDGSSVRDSLTVSLNRSGQFSSEPVTWTAEVYGGSGEYKYEFYLTGLFPPPASVVSDNSSTLSDNTFSYRFLASGDYELYLWVTDVQSGTRIFKSEEFSVPSSSGLPSISSTVDAIVSECIASGCTSDYEKALWLHDWLINNADYDLTYSHFGPDGVLLDGTGVCDSYSKAYYFLLSAAGIPADRVNNSNHAWNILQIAGEWYYVDTTWDDPVGGHFERHLYFCIPDEILSMDHPEYDSPHSCSSYEYNYFAQNGSGEAWANALVPTIQQGLQAGDFRYSVALADSYYVESRTYSYRSSPAVALADNVALTLAQKRSYQYEGKNIPLLLYKYHTYDTSGVAEVSAPDEATLSMPSEVTRIGPEAFMNVRSAMVANIPSQVSVIGDRAFAGCSGLWAVFIPPTVVGFGSNIFDQSNYHLTLIVEQGSPAETYAIQNNLKYAYFVDPASQTLPPTEIVIE